MWISIIELIIWLIAGLIALLNKKITIGTLKILYLLVWICLLIKIFSQIISR